MRRRAPLAVLEVGPFVLFGLVVAAVGPTSPLLLLPILIVWGAVVMAALGTQRVVTLSMMSVAFTAPMNGVRIGIVALTDVMLCVAALSLIAELLVCKRRTRPLPVYFVFGIALVVAGGLVGTLFADRPRVSLVHLLPFTFAATLPVIVVRMWGPSVATLRRYGWCWAAGAGLSGAIVLFFAGGVTGRPHGLTTHPNHLAMTCAFGATIALAIRLSDDGWRRQVALVTFGVLVMTVVRSGSRAGLVALIVGSGVVLLQTRHLRAAPERIGRGMLTLLVLVAVAGALLVSGFVKVGEQNAVRRLVGDASARESDSQRLPLLQENVRKIGDRPVTGSGFADALQAHNIYVQIWVAAGIAGLAGFLMLVGSVVREGTRKEPGQGAIEPLYIRTAFFAGYIGYLVAGLAQNILWDRYVWLHVAVIMWAGSSDGRANAPLNEALVGSDH